MNRQIPQLFVASGDDHLSDPSMFPWTMGWQPSIREEGRIYANYIQAFYPGKRIVALWQNDLFGRELFKAGRRARQHRPDDQGRHRLRYRRRASGHACIDPEAIGRRNFSHVAGMPANAAKVVRVAADLNWHPVFILNQMASSIATAPKSAGPGTALKRLWASSQPPS